KERLLEGKEEGRGVWRPKALQSLSGSERQNLLSGGKPMAGGNSVVIKLPNDQREAIKRATGKTISELKVDGLKARFTPGSFEDFRKAPAGFEDARKAPAGLEDARKAPAGFEDARKAPAGLEDARKAPAGLEDARKAPAGLEDARKAPAGLEDARK